MELFPQQLPYPYVHLSLSSYLLYYYIVAIVPASSNDIGHTVRRLHLLPTADCGPTICSMWTIGTRD
jgi:hypothetical protein